MSEYIVNLDGELGMALAVACAGAGFAREEIVRCRDCEYYDGEPDLDSLEPKCWRDPDHKGTPNWTSPDGYCWLGERRTK